MTLHRMEKANAIRSLARFNFIGGLPLSGVSVLTALLNQNPRFVARTSSPAQQVFANMVQTYGDGTEKGQILDDAQKTALWRGGINAIYHDRPFDSVVFDANRNWLHHMDILAGLFPLSRFVICVRNPAAIVNSLMLKAPAAQDEESQAQAVNTLVAPDGAIGAQIGLLRAALTSAHAERVFVLDYDRLVDDPEDVMDVLYDFLREPEFVHDFDDLGDDGLVSGPVQRPGHPSILPTRMVLQLSGRAFWRNLKRTRATMMLGRVR